MTALLLLVLVLMVLFFSCRCVCMCSGRVAWLCARTFNRLVHNKFPNAPPFFKYLISGDDEALIVSKELPEDDAV